MCSASADNPHYLADDRFANATCERLSRLTIAAFAESVAGPVGDRSSSADLIGEMMAEDPIFGNWIAKTLGHAKLCGLDFWHRQLPDALQSAACPLPDSVAGRHLRACATLIHHTHQPLAREATGERATEEAPGDTACPGGDSAAGGFQSGVTACPRRDGPRSLSTGDTALSGGKSGLADGGDTPRAWDLGDNPPAGVAPGGIAPVIAPGVTARAGGGDTSCGDRPGPAIAAGRGEQWLYNLAYGLSHELNNPLANIATRAGVLARDERVADRLEMLESIVDNAMRGCEMLRDLMLVARPPQMERRQVGLQAFFTSLVEHANQWSRPRGVLIRAVVPDVTLSLDSVAMREAMWALVRNGIEAMPEGGCISISGQVTALDAARCKPAASPPATAGRSQQTDGSTAQDGPSPADSERGAAAEILQLCIADEGQGISPEALRNCFDPYFSGREAGRGLGLGLNKALRIVEMHGGKLQLENSPDGGCVARIELPL